MANDKRNASPGFFSVLLGRGTANIGGDTQSKSEQKGTNYGRPSQPSQKPSASGQTSQNQRRGDYPIASKAAASAAPSAAPRSSMARDRRVDDSRRDASITRLSGPAAFEAALKSHSGPSGDRSKLDRKPSTYSKPQMSSMRSPRKENFVDAREVQKEEGEQLGDMRQSRKVSFRTPTSSLRKGKVGVPGFGAASSSQDSFFDPATARPAAAKVIQPKHVRSTSRFENEERNWNSSTATLPLKAEPRSIPGKDRRSKPSAYPLPSDARRDSFQAVRASGPDRVIIVPTMHQSSEDEPEPTVKYFSTSPPPFQRRPAPTPLSPTASMPRRPSQDISRSKSRSADVQRSRSQRERRGASAHVSTMAGYEADGLRSRVDKVAPRVSRSSRPLVDSMDANNRQPAAPRGYSGEGMQRASRQGAKASPYQESGPAPAPRERYSDARIKGQRQRV